MAVFQSNVDFTTIASIVFATLGWLDDGTGLSFWHESKMNKLINKTNSILTFFMILWNYITIVNDNLCARNHQALIQCINIHKKKQLIQPRTICPFLKLSLIVFYDKPQRIIYSSIILIYLMKSRASRKKETLLYHLFLFICVNITCNPISGDILIPISK